MAMAQPGLKDGGAVMKEEQEHAIGTQPPSSFRMLKLTPDQIYDAILAFYAQSKGEIPTSASGDASKYLGLPVGSATWRQINGRVYRMERAGKWTVPGAETLLKAVEAKRVIERQKERG